MNNKNILVVDDQENWRRNLGNILTENGYNTASAKDYDEAFNYLKNRGWDLVVADIFLDDLGLDGSGGRLIKYISENYNSITIIAITGEPRPIPIQKIRDLFVNYRIVDLIHKGFFNLESFESIINEGLKSTPKDLKNNEIDSNLSLLREEFERLVKVDDLFSKKYFQDIKSAIDTLSIKDNSDHIVSKKIESCFPIIPFLANLKIEIDLNKLENRTIDTLDLFLLKTCEKILKTWYKIKR